ncbi:hypothetical protein B0H19DRAFT_1072799 [Mycena capillaripes]|nr:hypothetical protein B0H19DRAFT_1072799 [Mycena capillaripes]
MLTWVLSLQARKAADHHDQKYRVQRPIDSQTDRQRAATEQTLCKTSLAASNRVISGAGVQDAFKKANASVAGVILDSGILIRGIWAAWQHTERARLISKRATSEDWSPKKKKKRQLDSIGWMNGEVYIITSHCGADLGDCWTSKRMSVGVHVQEEDPKTGTVRRGFDSGDSSQTGVTRPKNFRDTETLPTVYPRAPIATAQLRRGVQVICEDSLPPLMIVDSIGGRGKWQRGRERIGLERVNGRHSSSSVARWRRADSGGKVRFGNRSEPEPNLNRTRVRRPGSENA